MHQLLAVALMLAPASDAAERAGRLFGESRFTEAAEAFAEAYEESGDAAMLFGQAQAVRRSGNCRAAIDLFEAFIASGPPQRDVDAAKAAIDECRDVLGPAKPPPPRPPPRAAPPPDDAPAPPKWYRDVPGGALLGVGLGVAALGGGLLGGAYAVAGRPGDAERESGFEDRGARVQALSAAGISGLVIGGAVLVGAIVRYVVVARR